MGAKDRIIAQSVMETGIPPEGDEFELTLFGPGYGESVVMHVGGGVWIVVDSCLDTDRSTPRALRYFEDIGLDPTRAVALIVVTHWHDDHIRGVARMVERCSSASFCCASAFREKEFLTLIGALERRHFSESGSGLRELHGVFEEVVGTGRRWLHAIANCVVFQGETCKVWSLSPSNDLVQRFLKSVGALIPGRGEIKKRIPSLSPNEAAVALWVDAGDFALLLGADLERRGWEIIVGDTARPDGKASVFKVPHHGSEDADEPQVWQHMLESNPIAVLTPWHRGGQILPRKTDAERILAATSEAYISGVVEHLRRPDLRSGNKAVARTLRESGVRFRPLARRDGFVRLRRSFGSQASWTVEKFGSACHLQEYTA